MLSSFQSFVKDHALFQPEERILLAVSGGLDSVVMAHLFQQSGFRFAIAHCNFSLRDAESDADADFVRDLAGTFGVEYFVERFETAEFAAKHKYGIQEAARLLRYNWFEELRKKHQFDCISTAHHSDDSVETFFVNLTRGAGIAGLRGVPLKNGYVIRPLLFATKKEIRAYAHTGQLSFREDSSNASDKYLRNRIRHAVLPVLEELNPSIRKTVLKDMQHLADAGFVLHRLIEEQKKMYLHSDPSGFHILLKDLADKEPLRFYLFEWLKGYGFKESAILNLAEVLKKKEHAGKIFLSADYILLVERDRISVRKNEPDTPNEYALDRIKAVYSLPFELSTDLIEASAVWPIPDDASQAFLDVAKLEFPLLLRKWKEGDRFQPLGMKGSKLLSDFFADNKFSLTMKEATWVLESGGNIVWLLGHRLDDRYKLEPGAKEVFRVRLGE
jgi:tRNA(Ile)-lysidine synthase